MTTLPTPFRVLAGLLCCSALACKGAEEYDLHASETMARWADAKPTVAPDAFKAGSGEVPGAVAAVAGVRHLEGPAPVDGVQPMDQMEVADLAAPAAGGANPPDFLRPEREQAGTAVEVSLELQQGQALAPGGTATLRFMVTPLEYASELRVRYEVDGPAAVSPESSTIGAGVADKRVLATTQVTLQEGRSTVRAWAEGFDGSGKQIFSNNTALYFIVENGRVLAGPNGFTAVEIRELERQRDAGELSEEDFDQRMRLLRERQAGEINQLPGR